MAYIYENVKNHWGKFFERISKNKISCMKNNYCKFIT